MAVEVEFGIPGWPGRPPRRQERVGWSAADSAVVAAFGQRVWREARPAWTQSGWWAADLRPEVREMTLLTPGPDLQQRLVDLVAADRARGYRLGECPHPHYAPNIQERVGVPGSPCACQVVLVAAWAAVASWTAAEADQMVVEVAGATSVEQVLVAERPELGVVCDPAVEELAPALRVSPAGARYRLDGLRRIAGLPRLQAAVRCGSVWAWQAHVVATDLRHLPHSDQVRVVDQLLDRVERRRDQGLREWTLTDLRVQAKRIAARLDLDLTARRRDCHARRGVRLRLHGQGFATVAADLTDDIATRIFNRLTAVAAGVAADSDDPDDVGVPRTLEQRRADVFTDLLLGDTGGVASRPGGSHECSRPGMPGGGEVAVVVDVATLLTLGETPAEIPGCGPVPAQIARQLAADLPWRAWLTRTSAAGTQVVATSPTTYRPPAGLARLIRAREPHCRMPGCRTRAVDLDHVTPFPRGLTTEANLGPLCRRHHVLKTHLRWRAKITTDSHDPPVPEPDPLTWTWTTPAGITYTDQPAPPLDCAPPPI